MMVQAETWRRPFDHKKHKINPPFYYLLTNLYKKRGQAEVTTLYLLFQGCSSALSSFRVFRVVRGHVFALDLFFTCD